MKRAEEIDSGSSELSAKPDSWIKYRLTEYKKIFRRYGVKRDSEYINTALSLLQESFSRVMGLRPYIVQVAGAMVLFDGHIAEMATGEGKTITAALAAVMNGWTGMPCHVITANDYLAQRDEEYLRPFYDYCGLSSGYVTSDMKPPMRKKGYSAAITYTTAKEVTADFLRDRIALGDMQNFQRRIVKSFFQGVGPGAEC
ncbi:MAG: hypothetical protein ACOCSE_06090 [Chitinivibrionales bacterium]